MVLLPLPLRPTIATTSFGFRLRFNLSKIGTEGLDGYEKDTSAY
uniref:ATTAP1 n=1 Tax=Arundo donax TaxID=35708 RepID=A0A0A9CPZ8_ARUDO